VESRHRLWEVVRSFVADGGSVLLTTHYLEEAQALASRVVVIAAGGIVAQGGVDDITARAGLSRAHRVEGASLEEAFLRLTGGGS
jgi:ABC-2 type transport system ATP-binding protein